MPKARKPAPAETDTGRSKPSASPAKPAPIAQPSEPAFAFPEPASPLPAESKRGAIIAGLLITVLLVGAFAYWGWAMTSKWQEVRRYPSVAHAQTVLTKNADDAVAYRTLGYDAQKRGDTQTALRQWNEAARLEPDNMHSAWAYANLLWQTGKTSEAEALFQKIAKSTNQVLAPEATKALAKIKAGQAPDPPPAPPAS